MNEARELNWSLSNDKMLLRDQVKLVLGHIHKKGTPRDYTFFASLSNLGFRICEQLHLKGSDLRMGQIVVTRRKKKNLSARPVEVHGDVFALLERWAKKNGSGWLWSGESGPCFRNRQKHGKVYARERLCDGGHVCKREMQRRWTEYIEAVHLEHPGRGVHALRHYAITEFYQLRKDIRAAQEFAGHSTIIVTEKYAHVTKMKEQVQEMRPVL